MSTSRQESPEAGGSCATWSLTRASTRGSGARPIPPKPLPHRRCPLRVRL